MAKGGKMSDCDVDRILSKHDEILPSSGFAASVMGAVHREASAPPPIPFPWRRALPGIAVAAFALVLVVVVGVAAILQMSRGVLSLRAATTWSPLPWLAGQGTISSTVGWTALALVVALVSIKLSMHLAADKA
ncbi:MAG: hypothetical protein WA172_18415 [Terriglobales bacterium]